jgi:thymidylate synthase (FAD)
MVKHQHWSPFEMVSACFEIDTTRDIARQILRHRSFSFQEFSQRYAAVSELPPVEPREARLQDTKNRQNSIEVEDEDLQDWWTRAQNEVDYFTKVTYADALHKGIAKEVARAVLPEGLTPTRMYMSGTIRSWMHYCQLRSGNGTQKEHQEIAKQISETLATKLPQSWNALMEKPQ